MAVQLHTCDGCARFQIFIRVGVILRHLYRSTNILVYFHFLHQLLLTPAVKESEANTAISFQKSAAALHVLWFQNIWEKHLQGLRIVSEHCRQGEMECMKLQFGPTGLPLSEALRASTAPQFQKPTKQFRVLQALHMV